MNHNPVVYMFARQLYCAQPLNNNKKKIIKNLVEFMELNTININIILHCCVSRGDKQFGELTDNIKLIS